MVSKWNGEPPYREIDFGFVFVRAVRAGEAKLRGPAIESLLWLRRGRTKSISPGGRCPAVSRRCPAVSRGVPLVPLWCLTLLYVTLPYSYPYPYPYPYPTLPLITLPYPTRTLTLPYR